MKLELVSFSLCPYVQRSVITLNHKKIPYKLTYIDLESPPQWFEEQSPMGKVPILIVEDKTVVFESAVINEFVDEISGDPLHPKDPLQKALERAWIEYGSELLGTSYRLTMENKPEKMEKRLNELFEDLQRLENIVSSEGPYFRGKEFGLVDTSYAPLFTRLFLSEKIIHHPQWKKMPHVRSWAEALLQEPAVKTSVHADFEKDYLEYCREAGSLLY